MKRVAVSYLESVTPVFEENKETMRDLKDWNQVPP